MPGATPVMTRKSATIILTIAAFLAIPLVWAPLFPARAADAPADPRMVEHALGNPKAPVRIDEYYSLDCPHCADFDVNTLPQLKADYIDKGKVYLILHDFPLHELALKATMLARCAPPDRFIPIVDTLFHVQQGWLLASMGAAMDALKQQAKFAGLSESQINACLDDKELYDAILRKRFDAEKDLQIMATPKFIFNQVPSDRLEQPGPYDVFQKKIDALLKK
jgi:protein-disulfide isomerase